MKGIINHDLFTNGERTGKLAVIPKGTEVEIIAALSLSKIPCYKILIPTSNKYCHVNAEFADIVQGVY